MKRIILILLLLKAHSTYNKLDIFYDEYQTIDLGKAVTAYKVTRYGSTNIYWREFEKGYVYVNPTKNSVNSITLPELCKQRTHNNLKNDLESLSEINFISLDGHRATFLYKSSQFYTNKPDSPKNFRVMQN